MVRYYGLYANAHRGKVKKASLSPLAFLLVVKDPKRIPSKGWAEMIRKPHGGLRSAAMIRKLYEVDPMACPKCGGRMKSERKRMIFLEGMNPSAISITIFLTRIIREKAASRCRVSPWIN